MFAIVLLLLTLVVTVLPAGSAYASPNGVVISEFRFDGPAGAGDEFVELFNTSAAPVEISGWRLEGCAASSGAPSTRTTVPGGIVLEPGDHYLFTNTAYSNTGVPGDATYSTGLANTGGVRIVTSAGVAVDGVGSSDGVDQCREGAGLVLTGGSGDRSFERRNDGVQDTDVNVDDFVGPQAGDPQNFSGDGGGGEEPTITKIHDIQGAGSSSEKIGQTVTIEGIVTGWDDEIGANFERTFPEDAGIFVQEEQADVDSNPNTSEGIFVGFVRDRVALPLGSVVQVEGRVAEKFGFTILSETFGKEPVIVGAAPLLLPEPIVIDEALAEAQDPLARPYYESLESMRVILPVGVANSGGTNKFAELFLTPGPELDRVFRDETVPGLLATDADAGAGDPDNPFDDPDGSTTEVQGDLFDRVENVVGPLAFSFSNFKIMVQPGLLPTVIDGPTQYPYSGPAPAGDDEVRIASFNVENYLAIGAELDLGTVTAEDEAAKRTRIVDAIDRLLLRPDVVAVQEVQNKMLLDAVAVQLGGYTAYLEEGNDSRGIDVGFLVKSSVTASNVRQLGKTASGPAGFDCSDIDGGLFDRPPLFVDIATTNGRTFTVVSNHFSSKSAPDACREAQAAFVRDRVAEIEAAGGQVIVTGDLNAFEDEGALDVLQDGSTTLTNQWNTAPVDERYSFQFNGRLQTLDHILITDGLEADVTGFQYAHFDNDYFERNETTDGHKVSDHDPPVLTLSDAPIEPDVEWEIIITDGTSTFFVDFDDQQLRFTNGDLDTGVVVDLGMKINRGVVKGDLNTDEFRVRYTIPRQGNGKPRVEVWDNATDTHYVLTSR